jgi:hypothetical protein
MDVQLDVDVSSGTFADLTYQWIDEVSATLHPQIRQEVAALPAKLPRPASPQAPGTPFGVIGVERGMRRAARSASTAGLSWLRKELGGDQPKVVDLAFIEVDERGESRGRALDLSVVHHADESPSWLTLRGTPYVHVFEDVEAGPKEQRRWLEVLFAFADRTNPGFGHISLSHLGNTALEEAFPPKGRPFASRYWEYAVNECRQYLRGYSWVTVVAQELLPRLGGIDRLRDTGAFVDVRPLAAGGVWLQATADYRDFDDAALVRVFEAVAPALRPGLPRDLPAMPGMNPYRVVTRDAAERGAR